MRLWICILLACCGCQTKDHFRIAATAIPHQEILEQAKPLLASEGVDIEIITIEDYQTPNRALVEGEVDANFFQHLPFLELQKAQFGYALQSVGKVHIEPLSAYSCKTRSIEDGAIIALPSDPSNQARALILLEKLKLIELDSPTILAIRANPKGLKFHEIDAPLMPRVLDDVDIAIIPTNFALQNGLSPKDALFSEGDDSPYANIIVVRDGEEGRDEVITLIRVLKSQEMKEWILSHYAGAVIPSSD